ncbi:TetR/AcrR family transcriptional regulator [Flavobacterium sp. MXW15]|uniref:TetR/AcrR family transcriptional regulator n=1 Tax=Xanthomonas chitinilytica TaxID=2989819 RepID=A0ABT3JTG2_9XANT|nr:TetR/AcrR family transcriptional regulator [Xanthomonas sp. H13-6]MCW4454538.1 TetR/AcrR family transcriptional regulator [Flavobacterium sp. MXW15]MCW4471777.1 TetR/AcrR family transcriptional regulator [Xanthomonas sp. H13-6]
MSRKAPVPAPEKPAARASGPGRPKDLGKRAAILDAAKEMFVELGFNGVSMDGIAARAGVSKLTVYSHFGDKEALFLEAVQAKCVEMMPDALFVTDAEGPLRDQLLGIGEAFFTLVSSDAAIATQRMMMSPDTDDRVREMFWRAGPRRTHQALADFLRARVAAGELDIDDVDQAAHQFFCLVKGELHTHMMCGLCTQPAPPDARAHVRTTVDFFLRAYARR